MAIIMATIQNIYLLTECIHKDLKLNKIYSSRFPLNFPVSLFILSLSRKLLIDVTHRDKHTPYSAFRMF